MTDARALIQHVVTKDEELRRDLYAMGARGVGTVADLILERLVAALMKEPQERIDEAVAFLDAMQVWADFLPRKRRLREMLTGDPEAPQAGVFPRRF